MNHVGILGGSFNPIHIGHLILSQNILEEFNLDKILLVPNKHNPFKSNKSYQDINSCIEMLDIIKDDNPIFDIDLRETKGNRKHYTIDTIKGLKESNPDVQYYFIIGSDILEKLDKWYKISELFNIIPFIIVERPGYPIDFNKIKDLEDNHGAHFMLYHGPNINISSTAIRNKIYQNKSIKYLLPESIINYINRNKLYLKKDKEISNYKKNLKNDLKPKRFEHSINVMNTAVELAERFDADVQKAEIAGLLHDCAKGLNYDEMLKFAEDNNFNIPQEFKDSPNTLHALIGKLVAEKNYKINDPEILSAISKHTTGDKHMSKLDKIIFLADYIEPSRTQPGVDEIRDLANYDLDKAVFKTLDNNLNYLRENDIPINKFTQEAWESLKNNE